MHLFVGSSSTAKALLASYGMDDSLFVFLDHNLTGLKGLDKSCIESITITGMEWEQEPPRAALIEFGIHSQKILTSAQPSHLHARLIELGAKPADANELAHKLIYNDLIERQWYAYPLSLAIAQAKRMDVGKLFAIEFGVFTGNGLRALAELAAFLCTTTGIQIEVVGFDSGTGLPSVADWRDHPELWQQGSMSVDIHQVKASLPSNCTLIVGDIAETLPSFILANCRAERPLGFAAIDVDTYSSTCACLEIFNRNPEFCLPATPVYVDDSYVNITSSEFCGEALAIKEFNQRHELRKIEKKIVRTNREQKPWHHAIYFAHMFDHPARRQSGRANLDGLYHFRF